MLYETEINIGIERNDISAQYFSVEKRISSFVCNMSIIFLIARQKLALDNIV